jgi:hypothetical protein
MNPSIISLLKEMNPGDRDPSQGGVVRLVLLRHKYCKMNPSIISLHQEMNPGDGEPSQEGVVRLMLRQHKYCNVTHQ